MVPPEWLCRQHLIGEHHEVHTAVGSILGIGRWTENETRAGFAEPQNLVLRHDELVAEMLARGYYHGSPLPEFETRLFGRVDIIRSVSDLVERCPECRRRIYS
jgi:hypothetical protein